MKTASLVSLRLCVHRDGSILLTHRAGSTLRFGVELHLSDTVGQLLDTVGPVGPVGMSDNCRTLSDSTVGLSDRGPGIIFQHSAAAVRRALAPRPDELGSSSPRDTKHHNHFVCKDGAAWVEGWCFGSRACHSAWRLLAQGWGAMASINGVRLTFVGAGVAMRRVGERSSAVASVSRFESL